MIIGFTGSRDGLSDKQKLALMKEVILTYEHGGVDEAHHGACVGADHQFHDLMVWLIGAHRVVLHMPTNLTLVPLVMFQMPDSQKMKPLSYLDRNKEIVKACDRLIACPAQAKEVHRSGTWSTVRHARRLGRKVVLLTP